VPSLADWLKIDIEGIELPALCSARRLLTPERVQHLSMELNWDTTAENEVHAIRHILKRGGYRRAGVPDLDRDITRTSHYSSDFLKAGATKGRLLFPWSGYFSIRHKLYMATFSLDDGSADIPRRPPTQEPFHDSLAQRAVARRRRLPASRVAVRCSSHLGSTLPCTHTIVAHRTPTASRSLFRSVAHRNLPLPAFQGRNRIAPRSIPAQVETA
jgi:hypothetical protein